MVADLLLHDIQDQLDPKQYGNIKGKSTSHYLVYLLDVILKGLDTPNTMGALLLIDFKKAFDLIDHNVAINELHKMGCRPSILAFVADFLSGRRHRVRYDDTLSEYDGITCGVPQGTRLGVLVFLAVVDSLCRDVEHRAKFVDDLTMAELIKIRDAIVSQAQDRLNSLSTQCREKEIIANPIKCEAIYMNPSPAKRPWVYPDLHLNGVPLPIKYEVKLLGVYLNTQVDWSTHVTYIITKANRMIFILYRARQFGFSIATMLTLYQWYIRTGLEYAAPVWHAGLTEQQKTRLERVQKRCFRIILGDNYGSYREALVRLQTQTLFDRREALIIRFGKTLLKPAHRHMLPPTNWEVHQRTTRGAQRLRTVLTRTERYRKSAIPYIVEKLNSLA